MQYHSRFRVQGFAFRVSGLGLVGSQGIQERQTVSWHNHTHIRYTCTYTFDMQLCIYIYVFVYGLYYVCVYVRVGV